MDLQKTGVCIAQCRKARRLTRSQLARPPRRKRGRVLRRPFSLRCAASADNGAKHSARRCSRRDCSVGQSTPPRRCPSSRPRPRVGALLTLAAALALEWLPNGVEMRWVTPPGEPPHISCCACCSLLPAGCGNVFLLLTALATTLLLTAALAALLQKKPLGRRIFVGSVLALLFSLAGLLLLGALTPAGWGISLLLLASLARQALASRGA